LSPYVGTSTSATSQGLAKVRFLISPKNRHAKDGMALVLVLCSLVILTALVVSFLLAAGVEIKASSSYQATAATQQLASTVINLVQGEISTATSMQAPYSWASQPGAIWDFDGTGNVSSIYRLYSWSQMTTANSSDVAGSTPTDLAKIDNWSTSPALYVDLNANTTTEGVNRYPIVDPTAVVDGFSVTTPPAGGTGTNPLPMPVQWLYVLQDGQVVSPTGTSPTVTVTGATVANPIVGRIAYWTDDETCKVNINTAGGDNGGATPSIVSGVASQGTYTAIATNTFWDTPHFNSAEDTNFAGSQPVNGEFQRYPGHPATVALNYLISTLMGTSLSSPSFFSMMPRYAYGGSEGGTVPVSTNVTGIPLKTSHLYSSVEDMLFATNRTGTPINLTPSAALSEKIDASRFFLTAHSVAPELNLFGAPRISMWPVYNTGTAPTASAPVPIDANHITAADQTLAFCATTISGANAFPYYFTRANSESTTSDVTIARNTALLSYLDALTSQAIPGFGGNFNTKYGKLGTRQILTEIFDYIRMINSVDPHNPTGGSFNYPINVYAQGTPGSGNVAGQGEAVGEGQVVPTIDAAWGTQGFGSFPRLVEADLQFVGLGEGATNSENNTTTGLYPTNSPVIPTSGLGGPTPIYADQPPTAVSKHLNFLGDGVTPPPNTVAVQTYLLLNFLNPAHAFPWVPENQVFFVEVSGLDSMQLNGTALGFPADESCVGGAIKFHQVTSDLMTGSLDFRALVAGADGQGPRYLGAGRGAGVSDNPANGGNYPFYSSIVAITNSTPYTSPTNSSGQFFAPLPMNLSAGSGLTISIYAPANTTYTSLAGLTKGNLIQTYHVNFKDATIPTPVMATYRHIGAGEYASTGFVTNYDRWNDEAYSDPENRLIFDQYTNAVNVTVTNVNQSVNPPQTNIFTYVQRGQDVIQGMVLNTNSWGDARLLAISNVPANAFTTAPNYGKSAITYFAYGINMPGEANPARGAYGGHDTPGSSITGALVSGANYSAANGNFPLVPPQLTSATTTNGALGDWDNGIGAYPDGPYINKTDEGCEASADQANAPGTIPYYAWNKTYSAISFYSANRQVSSPGVLGSLPTGIDPTGSQPGAWQTLLFRPAPANHPASLSPPEDELFLDLFWMPVTDPYPLSESFATAGKVNLNYEIVPFTYINRSTAVRAAIGTEEITKMIFANATSYKGPPDYIGANVSGTRLSIDLGGESGDDSGVLSQFRDLFTGTGGFAPANSTGPMIFRSPAQICDIFLPPPGSALYLNPTLARNQMYGNNFALVGDNEREKPYADIYGKITTKSNTFKVYYTVQSLKAAASDLQAGQWNENRGAVTGQYIGSTTIERYLDPNDSSIPDVAAVVAAGGSIPSLDSHYRWRVVDNHQFVP
jgi:uncharacterized protein (TIGR02600 family)